MKKITARFPHLKILLVEDYFINQEVTKDILELMRCEVEVAEDGKQALELANQNAYDLIIMDLQIPEIDGYEVTKKIRSSSSVNQNTKIIALTANALDGEREKCLNTGMDDYMSKPIEADQIEVMLKKHFVEKMVMDG